MTLDKQTLLEAAKIIERRGVCAVTMINAEERLEEKKAYAWDALQHAIELRALASQQPESSRDAVLEEAAKVCNRYGEEARKWAFGEANFGAAYECGDRIRALKNAAPQVSGNAGHSAFSKEEL